MQLSQIKGLGPKSIEKLKEWGIETPSDLIFHFPSKYIDATNLNNFSDGEQVTAFARLINKEKKHVKSRLSYVKAEFLTQDNRVFSAVFFNQPFIFTALKLNNSYYIHGKTKITQEKIEISAPKIISFNRLRPIIPVYKSLSIGASVLQNAISYALKNININGFLPDELAKKYGLVDFNKALNDIHFPQNQIDIDNAKRCISLQSLSFYIKQFYTFKKKDITEKSFSYKNIDESEMLKGLEFELTNSQKQAKNRIFELMRAKKSMNALLEGDVGSGKTILAFLATRLAVLNGHQTAILSPTEILANQHYERAVKFFNREDVVLLTGSLSPQQRQEALTKIREKEAKIIIGTHSLFSKDVIYNDLTLIIIDEQHRFGVNQRGAMENKGSNPDCLNLSATPIPRSLALTLYGDLDLISLKEKPQKNTKIFTRFVGEKQDKMYEYILQKAKNNERTFIVCPRIFSEDEDGIMGAKNLFDRLKKGSLAQYVQLFHGKQSEREKSQAIDSFINGEKRVLVSTSIVEVGVDIKSATTMVIYNAERFGLSQLHQLRGRIGRGNLDSFCFLLTNEADPERLKYFIDCQDGFILSEKDFELRGAGDFLGFKQHGKSLTFSKEPITAQILILAKEIASQIPQINEISQENCKFFTDLTLN